MDLRRSPAAMLSARSGSSSATSTRIGLSPSRLASQYLRSPDKDWISARLTASLSAGRYNLVHDKQRFAPCRLPGPGRASHHRFVTPGTCSRAVRLDRGLRAIAIAVLAPLTAWVVMRWFAEPVDFHIYRYASVWALHGSDVYTGDITGPGIASGGLPYTYTPFALLALLPTTLASWRTAYHLWGLAAAFAVAWAENAVVVQVIP